MVDQYKQQFDGVMRREISRGEFLKFVGVALLGLVGVIGFFKNLHEIMPPQVPDKNQPAVGGYGRSAYGR
jgi:hypothetical protein